MPRRTSCCCAARCRPGSTRSTTAPRPSGSAGTRSAPTGRSTTACMHLPDAEQPDALVQPLRVRRRDRLGVPHARRASLRTPRRRATGTSSWRRGRSPGSTRSAALGRDRVRPDRRRVDHGRCRHAHGAGTASLRCDGTLQAARPRRAPFSVDGRQVTGSVSIGPGRTRRQVTCARIVSPASQPPVTQSTATAGTRPGSTRSAEPGMAAAGHQGRGAHRAGVSVGTVSNVLNRPDVVNERTRQQRARRHLRARASSATSRRGTCATGSVARSRTSCSTRATRSSPTSPEGPRRRPGRPGSRSSSATARRTRPGRPSTSTSCSSSACAACSSPRSTARPTGCARCPSYGVPVVLLDRAGRRPDRLVQRRRRRRRGRRPRGHPPARARAHPDRLRRRPDSITQVADRHRGALRACERAGVARRPARHAGHRRAHRRRGAPGRAADARLARPATPVRRLLRQRPARHRLPAADDPAGRRCARRDGDRRLRRHRVRRRRRGAADLGQPAAVRAGPAGL